jgi:uncharacterized repeat protein (TIGR04076 family)
LGVVAADRGEAFSPGKGEAEAPIDHDGSEQKEKVMGFKDTVWKGVKWKVIKKHLGYSDSEMQTFRENPRNADVLSKVPSLMGKTIIAEVVESHGCNSQHGVGDKFYFDGAGNLLTRKCPKKVCIYALNAATGLIFASNELLYAGVDPNEMRFKRAGCFDVGLECGGWGRVVLELQVVDRAET